MLDHALARAAYTSVQEKAVEIGDTIDTPQEAEAGAKQPRRPESQAGRSASRASARRQSGSQSQSAGSTVAEPTERPRNGSGKTRRNGNGSRSGSGSSGDGSSGQELGDLLAALRDLRDGDFSVRLAGSDDPLLDDISAAFNGIAERNERLASEAVRVSTTIGREGQMNERASIGRA
ncbi:MAG: hypothetical protein ACSLFK_07395, partial [Gemmatimonadaceae bacterium]